jgi:hypothetical protein
LTVIVAIALGALTATSRAADVSDPGAALPPDKLAAMRQLDGQDPVDPTTLEFSDGYAGAFKDSGDDSTIEELRLIAPQLMEAKAALERLPANLADRQDVVASTTLTAERLAGVRDVYAASVVEERFRELQAALQAVASDSTLAGYDDNRIVIDEWQGIAVDKDAARILFVGRSAYHSSATGEWVFSPRRQWDLRLVRESGRGFGGWRIAEAVAVQEQGS